MLENADMEKIYERFSEEIEPTEEMKELYNKFSEKILKLKDNFTEEQIKELESLEDIFSEITTLEVKQAFFKGFSVAKKLII